MTFVRLKSGKEKGISIIIVMIMGVGIVIK